jgi:hypothetical protein
MHFFVGTVTRAAVFPCEVEEPIRLTKTPLLQRDYHHITTPNRSKKLFMAGFVTVKGGSDEPKTGKISD